MKRVLVLATVLGLWSVPLTAGEFLMNDSGEAATALRMMFSEPVLITSFGDTLMNVSPSGESAEFILTGGELEASGGQWLNWEPTSAELVSAEWLASGWELPEDATAIDFVYEVTLDGINATVTIARHIDRNCLPFSVHYEITSLEALAGYAVAWDTDKYVDTDGNGNPQDDRNYVGPSLDMTYLENYNPTITLLIFNGGNDPVAKWEDMARDDFRIPHSVTLSAREIAAAIGIQPDEIADVSYQQIHMSETDLEYMTEYTASIERTARDPWIATLNAQSPGRYAVEAAIECRDGEVRRKRVYAWFIDGSYSPRAVGIHMLDIWNEVYDPETDRMYGYTETFFTDAEAQAKLAYLDAQGIERISAIDIIAFEQQRPLPILSDTADAMIVGVGDYAWIFANASHGQLRFSTEPAWNPDSAQRGAYYEENAPFLSQQYFDEFFQQYSAAVVLRRLVKRKL